MALQRCTNAVFVVLWHLTPCLQHAHRLRAPADTPPQPHGCIPQRSAEVWTAFPQHLYSSRPEEYRASTWKDEEQSALTWESGIINFRMIPQLHGRKIITLFVFLVLTFTTSRSPDLEASNSCLSVSELPVHAPSRNQNIFSITASMTLTFLSVSRNRCVNCKMYLGACWN